ncbi:hypothetical protein O181_043621 [Austropuccinia psidii MF-1]|uniref:DH domain-containing protein n=1 Tax=Austropuccinia psidii MF-1 TaxID=1389203 RepID=A0A9Q3HG55_9BASI|nr:hypothetical protein [Austropuccinia psidii MF-1]
MDRRSASPISSHRHIIQSSNNLKPRPISYSTNLLLSNPSNSFGPNSIHNDKNKSIPNLKTITQSSSLSTISNSDQINLITTNGTFVDVVVEGMGNGNDPSQGWQVPPELVFFLRSLGERLDPFSPTGRLISTNPASSGHTKSLTEALNHATLRPHTDQTAIIALFNELVATERTYLKRINALNQSYAIPLKQFSKSPQTKIIDKYEAISMFGKIDAIVAANSSLLNILDQSLSFLQNQPGTSIWANLISQELLNIQRPYRDYLAGYDVIKETEQKLLKKSDGFRQFCERTKEAMYDEGMGRVGLRELLMEPVQRVTRYILIFEQMLKKMSSTDPARDGLLACISTCNRLAVCELDDHLIKAATMWGLHRSIDHFPAILVKPGRYFIDSIDVLDVIPDTPNPTVLHCTLFLFNDTIVIAKKPANGHLTGKTLAGLDDLDRLVAAMKKSKSSTSLNAVVSARSEFLSKSLSGCSGHQFTPTKLKKGSMRFKGMVDVHDLIVVNEPTHIGTGTATEVSFDLYLDRPPQDVSERWTDRPYRHYVVCPPPSSAFSGHEKSLSISGYPSSTHSTHPYQSSTHSLSHKSHSTNTTNNHSVTLAERDRFLDNLRKSQALVKAVDDRSTVMRTKFVKENEKGTLIDSFWNLYDKRTYIAEQRKHRVVLQLVGTDSVDQLQFNNDPLDSTPPLMIIRANFNDPDDPECKVSVRRKPNSMFPLPNDDGEVVVVRSDCLSGLIVRIMQVHGFADLPPRISSPGMLSAPPQQVQFAGGSHPSSPSRGFRNKSGFGSSNASNGLYRTKSVSSKPSGPSGVGASQQTTSTAPLRPTLPLTTRSPGGPVWYRNGFGSMGVTTEDVENSAKVDTFGVKKSDSNPSLYGDLPRLKQSKQRTPSPARSTIKGKKRVDLFEDEKDEGAVNWTELESESRCSSVSGLSSYEDEGKFMRVGRRTRGLVGPRQLLPLDRESPTRPASEPVEKDRKSEGVGEFRRPTELIEGDGSRKASGSSIGKRSRSVEPPRRGEKVGEDGEERAKRVASGKMLSSSTLGFVRQIAPAGPLGSAILNRASSQEDRRTIENDRRREERKVTHRRRRNLQSNHEDDGNDKYHVIIDENRDLFSTGDSSDCLRDRLGEADDLSQGIKGKVKIMRNLLKKLRSEFAKIEGVNGSCNTAIPRSPGKLNLSEMANLNDLKIHHKIDLKVQLLIGDFERNLDGLETDLKNVETNENQLKNHVKKVEETFQQMKDVLQRRENDLKMTNEKLELMKELQTELEVENCHLYEAFNEELDKMYNDIQLPPGQAITSLVEDLKKMAEERGSLTTQLGSTQRQLELEIARSECLEQMLREAGLLT